MEEEQTVTVETDNSTEVNTEPTQVDNSDLPTIEPMETATEETPANEEVTEPKSKPLFDNLDKAIESYKNLQKKMGEQSTELGNLRKQAEELAVLKEKQEKFAKHYGYETVEEMETAQLDNEYKLQLASFEADEYAQYIDQTDYPDETRNLLLQYRKAPTDELLNMIEGEFSNEIIKKIAGKKAIFEQELNNSKQEQLNNQTMNSLQEYLNVEVPKYPDEFNNPAFTALYAEAFKTYGTNLDTARFVNMMRDFANSITKNNALNKSIEQQNIDSTSEIAGISSNNSTSSSSRTIASKKLSDLSPQELNYLSRNL